jgi:hypothetical protein
MTVGRSHQRKVAALDKSNQDEAERIGAFHLPLSRGRERDFTKNQTMSV